MVDRKSLAILVLFLNSRILGLVLTTEKTAQKSLEQGVLWHIHPTSNKEVEHVPKIEISEVIKREDWFEALVSPEQGQKSLSIAPITLQSITQSMDIKRKEKVRKNDAHVSNSSSNEYSFLSKLYATIEERKHFSGDGSYTKHLFDSGEEKIRKKIGEEAIELVLAQDRGEIISECSDLLYHLFVFLSEKDINPREVIDHLSKKT